MSRLSNEREFRAWGLIRQIALAVGIIHLYACESEAHPGNWVEMLAVDEDHKKGLSINDLRINHQQTARTPSNDANKVDIIERRRLTAKNTESKYDSSSDIEQHGAPVYDWIFFL
jgi:hypothetical protein